MEFMQKLLQTITYWVFDATKTQKTRLIVKISSLCILILGKFDYELLQRILLWNDRWLLALLFGGLGIRYMDDIVSYLRRRIVSFDPPQPVVQTPTIDWIWVDDLVSFMFEYNGLPVEDMKRYFDITNEGIKKLGDNFERVWIMGRGKDNRRILLSQDPEYVTMLLLSNADSDKIWRYTPTSVDYKPISSFE